MRLISHPILCNYYVTYRCNAKCGFCDIWERPSPYVDIETATKNLDDLKRLGVKVIDFTGGEPLLHQQIDQLLKLAKDRGFITTLTTNCLLYPKWADKLRGLVDMLHFSLDSPDEDEHNKSRGVACFDFVKQSITKAEALGERPDIIFTVFEHNVQQIEEVYNKFCAPNDLILILNPVFEYADVETGHKLSSETLSSLNRWSKKKNVYLNNAFVSLRKDGGNHIDDPVCRAASSTIVISPENKLMLPCYHLGIDEIPIENDLFNLYQSEKVQKLVALEGRLPACEGCTINCYMQPSFAVEINKYFWKALPSTLKYNWMKGTWKELF
ncbi:radical SAM protein [Fulvivirga sp. RKSG066]|uniref:radical SAM protein n=1 Tax=Fulvivirga aurantia TaxID=2529383 RepID=UPI0012BC7136|nr:radical SAM protein [Fulvivirga aurantia]MTI21956.1 radical SAM protein [Fulvivirga aurantia]